MNPALLLSNDDQARARIRTSLDESLIVEASAGTGKTTELVHRIVAVLKTERAKIDQVAAVTFTHKAAGELKLRLREELDKARRDAPVLEDALGRLEEASIGTIHSFCAQILRERPVEARVDPAFEELSEPQSNRVYLQAFRGWLEKRLGESSPALRRAFARLAWRDSWDASPPIEQLQWAGRKLVEWRDYPTAWQRDPFARDEEIRTILGQVAELAEMSRGPRRITDALYKGLAPVRALADWIERSEKAGARDYDTLESLLLKLGRDLRRDTKKGSGAYSDKVGREVLVAQRDDLLRWIEEFRRRADPDLAAGLRDEMIGLVDEYQQRKQRLGKLDFVDLLTCVRDLVHGNREARAHLQKRFTHLFIDEFQDTDPLQAEILLLLSADDLNESDWEQVTPKPGKLFLVGDPKQSIYKFRRADIVQYSRVRNNLIDRGVGFVRLTKSFRAVRPLQHLVNTAFETEMTGDVASGQADWAPLEECRPEPEGRPSIVVLPVPRPYKSRISREAINLCLPDAIAAYIAWLIDKSGWGFRARDIAVLFRRRTQAGNDLTREYARALEARSVPHLLAGSRSFHRREEVETLRAVLTAIEWPDDELNVFATLKGSLFAIPDEILLRYRHQYDRLNPFRKIEGEIDPVFAPVTEALALIRDLHRARNRQSFAATVNALIEATRAHAGFFLRPGGSQILANVARMADLARSFEISGGISFRGFVDELCAQAEKEDAAEAPVLEEDSDGVRLMTVHGAKGLEFPVVILADITANLAAREPDQYVDGAKRLCATRLLRCAPRELMENENSEGARERAEGVRVAYVAATRARDLLVIPAVGDEPLDGWLSPLHKAIYPSRANWRRSAAVPGLKFGESSVLSRPAEYDREGELSVRPGIVKPECGEHTVVWWDPAQLDLNVEGGLGFEHRQREVLVADDGGSMATYETWRASRLEMLVRGAEPQFNVFLASQADEAPPGDRITVEIASTERATTRPSGRRFGTLVHAVLRDVHLDAGAEEIGKLTALNARITGATPEERDAAQQAVVATLAHPVLQRARAAAQMYREYPIVLTIERRTLDGIIDLAFLEGDEWTVVDFKTEESLDGYAIQVQWYAHALARLTGKRAHGVLLGV